MKSVVLDTNTYVAFLKGNKEVAKIVQRASDVYVPFIVLGELFHGFYKGNKSAENIKILESFMKSDRVKVLHTTENTPLIFGEIATELGRMGKPMQQNDIWIAALCKESSSSLLTLDQGFKNIIGLKLVPLPN